MPLFVKAVSPISLNDTMWQLRHHYEGSWFDTRTDLGAGPYHSPYVDVANPGALVPWCPGLLRPAGLGFVAVPRRRGWVHRPERSVL